MISERTILRARAIHDAWRRRRVAERRGPASLEPPDILLVYDAVIYGTTTVYTSPEFNELLGSRERMAIQAVVDEVTGTSPIITVQLWTSPNERHWANKNGFAEILGAALTVGGTTHLAGYDSGSRPGHGAGRLAITLGGTSPKAHVRIWVSLRDLS